jgi:alkaline phosphatase D
MTQTMEQATTDLAAKANRHLWGHFAKHGEGITPPIITRGEGVTIWDDKGNQESDHWGTYLHELRALQKFIKDEGITGVVLVGGDIHVSRVLRYPTTKRAGYDMVQLIASPIHHRVLPQLNIFHMDLVRSASEPNVFMRVDVDSTVSPATLEATLINKNGEHVFSYRLTEDDLKPKA